MLKRKIAHQEVNTYMNNTQETSIISYPKLPHIRYFVTSIRYRNPHLHNALEIAMPLEGSAELSIHSKEHLMTKGDILVFNSGDIHEISTNGEPFLGLYAHIPPQFCKDYIPTFQSTEFSELYVREPELHSYLSSLMIDAATLYFRADPSIYYRCAAQTTLIVGSLMQYHPNRTISDSEYQVRNRNTMRATRILSYIKEHYAEPRLLQKIAEEENLTSSYLSHLFTETFNITFQQYLMRFRLEKAMQLLHSTNLPIYDICYECGFTDYRQLNRYCQEQFGLSASACRSVALLNKSAPFNPVMPQSSEYLFSDKEALEYLSTLKSS